ncbi:hypothetical protein GGQ80_003249 [Sphingomonas jinjuensis]|uniref:Response regulatory domain-containing protein n=1 Tax=Sphingomonas jinjuensis TaxID=535907 RepID=A0A840FCG9_9SPHN|nr:hypothetical protein [Sphingomonas jinjuensis]MBB4155329.1 hypothetical protein [Sphingomonas jinjuensis]
MIQIVPIAKTLLAGRRIFLAQSDAVVATRTVAAITGAGGAVSGPYATAAEGLAGFASLGRTADAAVVDLQLRDAGACRIADVLRRSGVPIVFLRNGSAEVPARFRTCPVLTRPTTDHQLVQTLARLLDPAAMIVEARASA